MAEALRPLTAVPLGEPVRLESLPEQPALQARLRAMGVRPGVQLQVLRRGYPGGLLHVRAGLLEFMLRRGEAAQMDTSPVVSPAPAADLLDTRDRP